MAFETFERQQLRFDSYDAIYISPHMDDVPWSCAGRILLERAHGKRSLVITVFGTGSQDDGRAGAFADYKKRKLEEEAAMAALDADFIWLNQPELLYRRASASELFRYVFPFLQLKRQALSRTLHRQLAELCDRYLAPQGTVFFPFAIGFHPDHRLVFDVGRALHAKGERDVQFYEDVPYALTPALRTHRLLYLGQPAPRKLWRDTSEINEMLFWRFGVWSRLTWFVVLSYLLVSYGLRFCLRASDALPGEPPPSAHELDIEATAQAKRAAMALYPSQVREFFPKGLDDALPRNPAGRVVERSWSFPGFPSQQRAVSLELE